MKMEKIKIKNVRLSYPNLFKTETFEGKDTGKFGSTFLLPKSDKKQAKMVQKAIDEAIEESGLKIKEDNRFMRDGDDADKDEYVDQWTIRAANTKRPLVVDRDRTPLAEEDQVVYAGCYVNAIISIWVQNNSYGRRINANLHGVQFVKDGEPFGDTSNNVSTDDFDDLEESDI